jgi:glycerol-3-phosphate acyltransferase
MLGQHHHRQSSSDISTLPEIILTSLRTPQDDEHLRNKNLILDVEGGLLRSPSIFPYFMLVAIEAGSFLRGLVLLCLYPLLCCLPQEVELQIMVIVCFMGLSEEKVARVARATLPKYFLEDVGREGFEVLRGMKRVAGVCSLLPRIMVEPFLKEYMGLEVVVGREVKMIKGRYVGLLEKESEGRLEQAKFNQTEMIGFRCSSSYFGYDHHQLFSWCKVRYYEWISFILVKYTASCLLPTFSFIHEIIL